MTTPIAPLVPGAAESLALARAVGAHLPARPGRSWRCRVEAEVGFRGRPAASAAVRVLDTAATAAALPVRPGTGAANLGAPAAEGAMRSYGVDLALAVLMALAGMPGPGA
ncbi:hypothetical protein [Kitasatospora griseola]|uniref:hypothetical protein n=1 Tax=Kitasatospora griseola TaxID=2064 RepID=UPI00343357C1